MALEILFESGSRALNRLRLERTCSRLLSITGNASRDLTLLVTDNEGITRLNRQWFGRPWPTNVISFGLDDPDCLGDMAISWQRAAEEAEAGLTTLDVRMAELFIHGLLHLMGQEHEGGGEEARRMEQMEFELKKELFRRDIMADLCVNVDHIATIRQARGGVEPDPVVAAGIVELAGADGVVVHLREDRRHIQDRDVRLIRQIVQTRLTLEMAATDEMLGIAEEIRPDVVTLVPEKREEITTEGGLDVAGLEGSIRDAVGRLHDAGIVVSLFVDPEPDQIEASSRVGADCIEIHTGRYAEARGGAQDREFDQIVEMARRGSELGLRVHAGHGLNYQNTGRLAAISDIVEFSIGHSIVSRAAFVGLERAVKEMNRLIKGF